MKLIYYLIFLIQYIFICNYKKKKKKKKNSLKNNDDNIYINFIKNKYC